jgi:hypothetical protein
MTNGPTRTKSVQSAAVGHHNGTPAHADLHVKPYASRHVKVKADSCRSFSASRAWRGASAPSAEPACCAESAGQGSSRPTAVDRWRPTLQARGGHRQRGRSWVRRGSNGHQLDRMGGVRLPVTTCLVGKPRRRPGRRVRTRVALAAGCGRRGRVGHRYGSPTHCRVCPARRAHNMCSGTCSSARFFWDQNVFRILMMCCYARDRTRRPAVA